LPIKCLRGGFLGGVSAQLFCSPVTTSKVMSYVPFNRQNLRMYFKPTVIAWWVDAEHRERDCGAALRENVVDNSLVMSIEPVRAPESTFERAKMRMHLLL